MYSAQLWKNQKQQGWYLKYNIVSKKQIRKKAYSKKIAYCHPEEKPEEWQEVHFAYVSIKEFLDAKKEAEIFSKFCLGK